MALEYISSRVLPGDEAVKFLRNLVHPQTQVQKRGVDLTCKQVSILEGSGRIDFGGSELELGKKKKYPKVRRDETDKFGWWQLGGGQYVVEYNEELALPEDKTAILFPKAELLQNEASHPTIIISGGEKLPAMCLSVGPPGINIKANARISRLMVLDL